MKLLRFFDKFEDAVRGALSHWPIVYGFFGGVGIVLFWRGVWHTADFVSALLIARNGGNATIDFAMLPDGPVSLLLGSIILLSTGQASVVSRLFVPSALQGTPAPIAVDERYTQIQDWPAQETALARRNQRLTEHYLHLFPEVF
jgi:hypothetical protein